METALYKAVPFHLWKQRRVPVWNKYCDISVFSKSRTELYAEPWLSSLSAQCTISTSYSVMKYMVQSERAPSPGCFPGLGEGDPLVFAQSLAERWCLTSRPLQENSCAPGWCILCDLLLSYLPLPVPHLPETWDPVQSSPNWQCFKVSYPDSSPNYPGFGSDLGFLWKRKGLMLELVASLTTVCYTEVKYVKVIL